MPYDPYNYGSLYQNPYAAALPRMRRPSPLPDLSAEQENSIYDRITGGLSAGVGWAGEVLDKAFGGRAVRGLLGGKPEELLSVIPGSDLAGITDPQNAVSGKQLLQNAGVLDQGDDSWLGTGAGIGAELLLDPGSYLTLGGAALTKAGLAAKNAKTLAPTIAARARVGQGGLFGVGLPFMKPSMVVGANPTGAAVAEGIGDAAHWLGHTSPLKKVYEPLERNVLEPVGRWKNALFDKAVRGRWTAEGQEAGRAATTAFEAQEPLYREQIAGLGRKLQDAGLGDAAGNELLRAIDEGTYTGPALAPDHPAMEAVNLLKGLREQEFTGRQALDSSVQRLIDTSIDHSPRQLNPAVYDARRGGGMGAFDLEPGVLAAREDIFKNIPTGTAGIEAMAKDKAISGPARTVGGANPDLVAAARIRRKHLGMSGQDVADVFGYNAPRQAVERELAKAQAELAKITRSTGFTNHPTFQRAVDDARAKLLVNKSYVEQQLADAINAYNKGGQTPALQQAVDAALAHKQRLETLAARYENSFNLADWAKALPEIHAAQGVPFYDPSYLRSNLNYLTGSARQRADLGEGVYGLIGKHASRGAVAETVGLGRFLEQLGLGRNNTAALTDLAGRLGTTADQVAGYSLPEKVAKDVLNSRSTFRYPQAVERGLDLFDRALDFTKTSWTSPWPAFNVRNFLAGQWTNADAGLWASPREANLLASGQTVPGLAARLPQLGATDEAATRKFLDLAYAHRVAGGGSAGDYLFAAANPTSDFMSQMPGQAKSLKDIGNLYLDPFRAGKEKSPFARDPKYPIQKNPLGEWGLNPDFGPFAAGREATRKVEDVNRLGAFLSGMEQGMTPEEAARQATAAHFNYGDMTGFEREVMRRLVPFWGWTRSNLPRQIESLVQRPSGLTGRAVRLAPELQDPQETFTPDYLGRGLAIPVGSEKEGTTRFLTNLGLPFEDLGMIRGGPNWLQETALGLLGQTNPLIKGPLEYATGKQFYSGRDLEDLHSRTGAPVLEQAIMNSPLARAASTLGTLTDTRKWQDPLALFTNLLTGVRLSDVDTVKHREIAAKEAINQLLAGEEGVRRFERFFVPNAALGTLDPQTLELVQLQRALEKRQRERAKTGG